MTAGDAGARIQHLDPARRELLARLVSARSGIRNRYPVSATQFGMWLFEHLHPDSGAYHNPAALLLDGPVDLMALERALRGLQERHAALRTRFVEDDEGLPGQVVEDRMPLELVVVDAGDDDEALRAAVAGAATPFDLEQGPPWRATVVRLPDDRHVLLITMHHLISDGWSLGVLFGELDVLYRAHRRGDTADLGPAARPFGAFVEADAQRLDDGERERLAAHWTAVLDGVPRTIGLGATPAALEPRAAEVRVAVPGPDADALATVARRNRTSLFSALTALFAVALFERSGQRDFVITTPVANRADPASHGVIGCFLNTVPIPVHLRADQNFGDLVGECGRQIRTAVAHSLLPFATISTLGVVGRSPLGNVMIVQNNASDVPATFLDVPARAFPLPVQGVKQDWALHMTMSPERLEGVIEYAANRFEHASMVTVAERIEALAARLATRPDSPII